MKINWHSTVYMKAIILLISCFQLCSLKALYISPRVYPSVDLDKLKCLFNAGYLDEIFVEY